jgi:hypothetical protein
MMNIKKFPAKSNNHSLPKRHYRPGDPLPASNVKVDAHETLRRHAEAYEIYLRDEAARMARTGKKVAA